MHHYGAVSPTRPVSEAKQLIDINSVLLDGIQTELRRDDNFGRISTFNTFASLLLLGFIYQSIILYDTLAQKNTIQLLGLCISAACIFVYTMLQIDGATKAIEDKYGGQENTQSYPILGYCQALGETIASTSGAYMVVLIGCTYKLYQEFQWTIYRQLNADLTMQRRYFVFKVCFHRLFVFTNRRGDNDHHTHSCCRYVQRSSSLTSSFSLASMCNTLC